MHSNEIGRNETGESLDDYRADVAAAFLHHTADQLAYEIEHTDDLAGMIGAAHRAELQLRALRDMADR